MWTLIRLLLVQELLSFLEPERKAGHRYGQESISQEPMDYMDYLEFIARVTSHIPDKEYIYFAADKPFEPGSMFTIEPGIYIPEKNLGVRIEDDILVTETGFEIPTKEAPKEIEEIEKLIKENPLHRK